MSDECREAFEKIALGSFGQGIYERKLARETLAKADAAGGGWISVKEGLPKTTAFFWVWNDYFNRASEVEFFTSHQAWICPMKNWVTHWQPLPEAPK